MMLTSYNEIPRQLEPMSSKNNLYVWGDSQTSVLTYVTRPTKRNRKILLLMPIFFLSQMPKYEPMQIVA